MATAKYRHAHQQERKRWAPIVAAGQAYCQQPVCVKRTRWIPPGARWCLGHNDAGTAWIGPVHEQCNARDGAVRGNRARGRRKTRPAPVRQRPGNRWQL